MGIIDEIVPPDDLARRANEIALQLADIPAETFRVTKHQLRARASGGDIVEMWSSPAAHERIRNYLARTIGKKSS